MNLIEALKSGKRIRQKSKEIWLEPKQGKYFSIDHILSDDWEVEEVAVTITRAQLIEAYRTAHNKVENKDGIRNTCHLTALAEELGI